MRYFTIYATEYMIAILKFMSCMFMETSLLFPMDQIENKSALIQFVVCTTGGKLLSEPW